MTNWISCKDRLPRPNQFVLVDWEPSDTVKFVTNSDGDYFWDNMVNCIYQSNESSTPLLT